MSEFSFLPKGEKSHQNNKINTMERWGEFLASGAIRAMQQIHNLTIAYIRKEILDRNCEIKPIQSRFHRFI